MSHVESGKKHDYWWKACMQTGNCAAFVISYLFSTSFELLECLIMVVCKRNAKVKNSNCETVRRHIFKASSASTLGNRPRRRLPRAALTSKGRWFGPTLWWLRKGPCSRPLIVDLSSEFAGVSVGSYGKPLTEWRDHAAFSAILPRRGRGKNP